MRRFLQIAVGLVVLLVAGAAIFEAVKNPERADLDASSRAGVTGRFVGSSSGITHYEVTGPDTGAVVVLVHGFSVPAYIWDSTFATLGNAGYRTIRYDLFGRGFSDRPDLAYDGAMYDAQLNDLLDSLHVTTPVNLMGLSFGGFVTAHFAGTHAVRVRSLTLMDPVARSMSVPSVLRMPVVGPWMWQSMQVPNMAAGQASDFLHPEHFPTWADQYRPQMRFRGFGRSLLRTAYTLNTTNMDSLYATVGRTGVPALLIWGKQDHTVPIELSDALRHDVPQAEFFPVDSAGHLPHIEQAPVVRAKMLSFLAAHGH